MFHLFQQYKEYEMIIM